MDWQLFTAFLLITLVLFLIPGPIVTLVVATTVNKGLRAGLVTVAGTSCGTAVLLAVIARPALHILRTIRNDKNEVVAPANGRIDDASRLDEMPIAEIWKLPAGREEAEKQLADLLQRCRTNHLKISIAGARHSMGGHTISRDGVVIDMDGETHPDLIIRNTDGTLGVWYLGGSQGNQITGFAQVTPQGNTNWRMLTAHWFESICATSTPGAIRRRSGMVVAPERRISS